MLTFDSFALTPDNAVIVAHRPLFSARNFLIPFCFIDGAVERLIENITAEQAVIVIDRLGVERPTSLVAAGRRANL